MFSKFVQCLLLVAAGLNCTLAYAGVTVERTRVIVHEGQRETSLALVNQNAYPVLIQTWIDNGDLDATPETASAPIVPLPAVFRLEPQQQRTLRLVATAQPVAQDRESLYWLNVYEIPPRPDEGGDANSLRLTITLRTQLKVIYRPRKLSREAEKAPMRMVVRADGHTVQLNNPTPFYITLAKAEICEGDRSTPLGATLLPPFSTQQQTVDGTLSNGAEFRFSWLDDDGNSQAARLPLW